MTDIKMLLICVLVILLVIDNLIIAKQNKMLRWALPIIDQLYKERHGEEE